MARHFESYAEPATGVELTKRGALAVHALRSGRWVETAFLTYPDSEPHEVGGYFVPARQRLGYYVAADDRTIVASVGGESSLQPRLANSAELVAKTRRLTKKFF